jgi:hypothetical protein
MRVVMLDANGKKVSEEWADIPNPEIVNANSLSYMQPYVARMLASSAQFISLIVFSGDGQRGILLMRKDNQVNLGITVEWRRQQDKEETVRRFFSERGITPNRDYLAGNGNVPDATRVLHYPLEGDEERVTEICVQALREVCGIGDQDRLDFTYQEHP